MSDEVDIKSYVDVIAKVNYLKILIHRIRMASKSYEIEIQNSIEILLSEHELYLENIENNLFTYFRDNKKKKKELSTLNVKESSLMEVYKQLDEGRYTKRVTDKEYQEFLKQVKKKVLEKKFYNWFWTRRNKLCI